MTEKETCQTCQGKGTVVQPVMVWNHQEKDYRMIWRSSLCLDCGGEGKR